MISRCRFCTYLGFKQQSHFFKEHFKQMMRVTPLKGHHSPGAF